MSLQIETVLDVVSLIALDIKTAMEQIINNVCPHVHIHTTTTTRDPQNSRNERSNHSDGGGSCFRSHAQNIDDKDILTSSLHAVSDP